MRTSCPSSRVLPWWVAGGLLIACAAPPEMTSGPAPGPRSGAAMAVALAQAGLGVAIVPSVVKLDLSRIALAGLVHDGRPLGRWARVAWDSRRYLPSYAAEFIEELAKYMKRSYPGHRLKSTRDIARPRDTLVR